MEKGGTSLKRKASDALHGDDELLKMQKTMDRDKNGEHQFWNERFSLFLLEMSFKHW